MPGHQLAFAYSTWSTDHVTGSIISHAAAHQQYSDNFWLTLKLHWCSWIKNHGHLQFKLNFVYNFIIFCLTFKSIKFLFIYTFYFLYLACLFEYNCDCMQTKVRGWRAIWLQAMTYTNKYKLQNIITEFKYFPDV